VTDERTETAGGHRGGRWYGPSGGASFERNCFPAKIELVSWLRRSRRCGSGEKTSGRGARLLNEPKSVDCRRGLSTTVKIEGARQAHFQHLPLNCWRTFCEGFEMASTGAVYHPEEIELMTAALDDAVVLANGQRTSAVKVRFARRILASAAKGERNPVELRISALLGAADDDC
jgi:hypothetical protein